MNTWARVGLFAFIVALLTALTAPFLWGRLPDHASTIAPKVDIFWNVIAWVTTAMFYIVEVGIVFFCILYRRRPGVKPVYTHGNRTAELVWTVIPGLMLFTLALLQLDVWAEAKLQFPKPEEKPVTLQVLAQQFEWNFRYRKSENSEDFKNVVVQDLETDAWDQPAPDEIAAANMFVPVNRKALITMTSMDVIHSLAIPHMRVKQDAVPGMHVRVWFQPVKFAILELESQKRDWVTSEEDYRARYDDKRVGIYGFGFKQVQTSGEYGALLAKVDVLYRGKVERDVPAADVKHALYVYEIACAELCGTQHYKMNSKLWVGTQAMYEAWLGRNGNNTADKWKFWIDRKAAW